MNRFFLLITATLLTSSISAQGLTETYDAQCECTRVENHFDNGSVSNAFTTVGGKKEGQEKIFYQDGQVQTIRHWTAGKLNGEGMHYHRNGQEHYNELYAIGKKIGVWEFKDEAGDLILKIDYSKTNQEEFTYYDAGMAYLTQRLTKGKLTSEEILNEEIYQAKIAEAKASESLKKPLPQN